VVRRVALGSIVLDRAATASVSSEELVLTRTEYSCSRRWLQLPAMSSRTARCSRRAGRRAEPGPQWLKPHLARIRSKLEAAGHRSGSVRGVGYAWKKRVTAAPQRNPPLRHARDPPLRYARDRKHEAALPAKVRGRSAIYGRVAGSVELPQGNGVRPSKIRK